MIGLCFWTIAILAFSTHFLWIFARKKGQRRKLRAANRRHLTKLYFACFICITYKKCQCFILSLTYQLHEIKFLHSNLNFVLNVLNLNNSIQQNPRSKSGTPLSGDTVATSMNDTVTSNNSSNNGEENQSISDNKPKITVAWPEIVDSLEDQLQKLCAIHRHTVAMARSTVDEDDTGLRYLLNGPPQQSALLRVYARGAYFPVLSAYMEATVAFYRRAVLMFHPSDNCTNKETHFGGLAEEEQAKFFTATELDSKNVQQMFQGLYLYTHRY